MTNQVAHGEDGRTRVRALLWISGSDEVTLSAPIKYGGQLLKEQERIVKRHAKQHGVTLTNNDLFVTFVPDGTPLSDRMGQLVAFVVDRPTDELYVSESIFADLSPADIKMHIATLRVHDVDLIFCEDE